MSAIFGSAEMKACWLDWTWADRELNSWNVPDEFDISLLELLLLIPDIKNNKR